MKLKEKEFANNYRHSGLKQCAIGAIGSGFLSGVRLKSKPVSGSRYNSSIAGLIELSRMFTCCFWFLKNIHHSRTQKNPVPFILYEPPLRWRCGLRFLHVLVEDANELCFADAAIPKMSGSLYVVGPFRTFLFA